MSGRRRPGVSSRTVPEGTGLGVGGAGFRHGRFLKGGGRRVGGGAGGAPPLHCGPWVNRSPSSSSRARCPVSCASRRTATSPGWGTRSSPARRTPSGRGPAASLARQLLATGQRRQDPHVRQHRHRRAGPRLHRRRALRRRPRHVPVLEAGHGAVLRGAGRRGRQRRRLSGRRGRRRGRGRRSVSRRTSSSIPAVLRDRSAAALAKWKANH